MGLEVLTVSSVCDPNSGSCTSARFVSCQMSSMTVTIRPMGQNCSDGKALLPERPSDEAEDHGELNTRILMSRC
jgi:hypothetical protein